MVEHQRCQILDAWDTKHPVRCTCYDSRKLLCRHVCGYLLLHEMIDWPATKDPRPTAPRKAGAAAKSKGGGAWSGK